MRRKSFLNLANRAGDLLLRDADRKMRHALLILCYRHPLVSIDRHRNIVHKGHMIFHIGAPLGRGVAVHLADADEDSVGALSSCAGYSLLFIVFIYSLVIMKSGFISKLL